MTDTNENDPDEMLNTSIREFSSKSPQKKFEEIQEALKPLGYVVHGYKEKYRTERTILCLKHYYTISSDMPG
jgi:hypothetical protein